MRAFILSIAAALLVANSALNSALAAEHRGVAPSCGFCNSSDCQVVREMKTVKKSYWVVEYEQFCPMLPSCPKWSCGDLSFFGSKKPCGSCDGEAGCGDCGKGCKSRPLVPPKCAKSRTIKKLIKKEYTCEVPIYRCVTCAGCGPAGCGGEEEAPPAVPAKAPSTAEAPLPWMTSLFQWREPAER